MDKEELQQQLTISDAKIDECNQEIMKQKNRTNTADVRLVIREWGFQRDYWQRHKANIAELLTEGAQ